MHAGGRLARSPRSPRPQADQEAAAIGVAREWLGLSRARARRGLDREQSNRLVAMVERHLPNRTGVAATVLLMLGSAGFGIVKGGHL